MSVGNNKRIKQRLKNEDLTKKQRSTLTKRAANNRLAANKLAATNKAQRGSGQQNYGRGNASGPSSGGVGPSSKNAAKKRGLTFQGKTGINRVQTGPGSARKNKEYQVAQGKGGQFFHVYKSGKRKGLSKAVAKAYGYIK